jgi:ApbE superfamily uncharacterized protein (UPF0280 family)
MNPEASVPHAGPGSLGAIRADLPDGRLHLQHGPIDLVIDAVGPAEEVSRAYDQASACFGAVLDCLVDELPTLKRPLGGALPVVRGPVARLMVQAVWPYRNRYITPMAAVAGSVAHHVLEHALAGRLLRRAYVNNGGDIALWLAPGEIFTLGVVSRLDAPQLDRRIPVPAASLVRGVATSGWGGRSFSLGIADAVTVFAADAPAADAAATMIANAVMVRHAGIRQVPANTIQEDTDLGALPVTVAVDIRDPVVLGEALGGGAAEAQRFVDEGWILGALLFLAGQCRSVGWAGALNAN